MISYFEYLNMPTKIGIVIIGCFCVMQIIGELIEFKGKVVPEFFKIRKIFRRRKEEKAATTKTLNDVKQLLEDVNAHYSKDNISKRDEWMQWVNDRAVVYDETIVDITANLANVTKALENNTRLTEDMFIQGSRDRIINFATKVADESMPVSREEFHRINKVYDDYEAYLEQHEIPNGEVEVAHRIIMEAYEFRIKNHSFIEDVRGYM